MKIITGLAKLAMVLFLGGTAISANAQNVIQEGETFKVMDEVVYQFTPAVSGNLTISIAGAANYNYFPTGSSGMLYTSSQLTQQSQIKCSSYTEGGGKVDYIYRNIEGGKTYYFYQFVYNNVDCTFSMKEVGEATGSIVQVDPSTDNFINYVSSSEIKVYGSEGISSYGAAKLTYGNNVVELTPSVYGIEQNGPESNLFLQIGGGGYPAFQALLNTAANAGADSFSISIEGMKAGGFTITQNETGETGVGVDNGTVTLTYPLAPAPVYNASASTWPSTFYSSWQENDPAAVATLSFSKELKSSETVTIMMGHFTAGMITEMDSYDVTPQIDGNKLIIDFSGVERKSNVREITVIVQNVKDTDGLSAIMEASGDGYSSALFQYITYSAEAAPENPNTPSEPDEPDTPEVPEYMNTRATQVNDAISEFDSAIELTWAETVTIVDAETLEIPVSFGGEVIGSLSSTYVNLVGSGTSQPASVVPQAETGESGTTMYLLLGASGLLQESGLYTLTLPAGIVKNAEGSINNQQMVAVIYTASAEGSVYPESGATFEYGEDVMIYITFEDDIEQNYSPDAPVIVTNYGDFDEQYYWAPGVVEIDFDTIVINLGNELEEGTYNLSLREGVVLVNGAANAPIDDYMFTVAPAGKHPEVVGGLENYMTYTTLNAPEYALVTWGYAPIELGEGSVNVNIYNSVTYDEENIELPAEALVLRYIETAEEGGEPSPATRAEEIYNALEINFGEYLPENTLGNLFITIPEGLVTINGTPAEEYEIVINIQPVFEGEPTITNEEGILSIVWEGYGVYVNYESEDAYISDTNGEVMYLEYASPYDGVENPDITDIEGEVEIDGDLYPDFVGLLVNLAKLELADGDYTLYLPLGYLTIHTPDYLYNWYSNTVSWAFTVKDGEIKAETSGISSIESVKAIDGIYNLQGVKVNENNLGRGIYIINGKKVFVK